MADGYFCEHCGWQETSHDLFGDPKEVSNKEARQRIPGYRFTLAQCVERFGFKPPKQAMKSPEQILFEIECMERQARSNVAWGNFGALMRQRNFDKELAEIEDPEKRKAFIARGVAANHVMHIGFY